MDSVDHRSTLRAEGRAARRAVDGEARRRAELRLTGHLGELHMLSTASTVGVYFSDDGEPDLAPLIEMMRARGQGVALPVPVVDGDHYSMTFRIWHGDDDLEPGPLGIPCPPQGPKREIAPDAVLVPLVRFDPQGTRMGRGAGFYDRWLGAHRPRRAGVGFEVQRCGSLPAQPHDVSLEVIVTELGIRFPVPTENA